MTDRIQVLNVFVNCVIRRFQRQQYKCSDNYEHLNFSSLVIDIEARQKKGGKNPLLSGIQFSLTLTSVVKGINSKCLFLLSEV